MCDTIYRQEAIDQLHQSYNLLDAEQRLEDLPSAQPQGKWILETYQIRCSHCNKLFSDYLFPAKYCPNCGARMEGAR